ncbi:Endonuclease/exonuclease/phosphatase [Sulfurimonas denitrificans DSM 1251]|jgi:endonuclease/exonuclease/phosphatase (EEP) superfamily protein YafD|uniref:Endonuclease/exonuclease/phosphatase n=1 Tax=Sulfurimonas denitrificans (strain ATCC 33889 / DSM 1251) TaxID=326298 RepID=Q30RE6_SULDN|nr:endonuclease/exonuclease/phosphatase family protein [Sulfurimonas denitrificans]ABB44435.1 Endonuclease/exonuclease/phosphatase [Sulfurimonas denitrificans DSM 1251]MDD3442950.1 endonuclease/exonuclease/phosphatase family protein [Sulfurimonas denitrificans]
MFKPKSIIKSLKHQELDLSQEFNLLCWNVAKLTLKSSYKEFVDSLIHEHKLDILLLQEVKKHLSHEIELQDYSYVLSPNIETKKHIFGVLSAFKTSCHSERSLLSKKQELRYATHKTSLITYHKISNEQTLLIANLHAINFVKSSDFKHELDELHVGIKNHQGAMIVAGDFNTWSAKRVSYLREFSSSLELKQVDFKNEKDIKRVFSNTLDYIFYRGVELVSSIVVDSKKISDHNPIIAKFKL